MIKAIARYILRNEPVKTAPIKNPLIYNMTLSGAELQEACEMAKTPKFRALIYKLANEVEEIEQGVTAPDEVHKFWFCQGAKHILHTMINFHLVIKPVQERVESQGQDVSNYQ